MIGENGTEWITDNMFSTPFGVTRRGDILRFVVSVPQTAECKLKLYKAGCSDAVSTIPFQSIQKMGNIRFADVDNNSLNADSYCYEIDGKEMIDFYAKKIIGREKFGAYLSREEKSFVRGAWEFERFHWDDDKSPSYRFADMILYKLHVRGFSKQAGSEIKHKGTFLGIAEKASYLKELGINAVLLMPCYEFDEIIQNIQEGYGKPDTVLNNAERKETGEGLDRLEYHINYWGYSDGNNYFAPKTSYASNSSKAGEELKQMVKTLHKHGIEVLMEMNFGEEVSQLQIIDILRYWKLEYHMDGFRFDTNIVSGLCITGDPLLAGVKLIAADWNKSCMMDKPISSADVRLALYHDGFLSDTRMFLKGDEGQVNNYINRTIQGVNQTGIINYISENNGFTLYDVYAYNKKHNEENGEENQDGTNYNFSWNCGTEGKTRKRAINELRLKMRKNAIAALMLSQGTPMIYAGDEFGNSQSGNNNAYCQDNTIGWVDWKAKKSKDDFFNFVKEMIAVRKEHIMLHFPTMLRKMDYISCGSPDVSFHGKKAWYPDFSLQSRMLGVMLCGRYANLIDEAGDDDFYIAYNMHWEAHLFDLPSMTSDTYWELLISTSAGEMKEEVAETEEIPNDYGRKRYLIAPRSIAVFINKRGRKIKGKKNKSKNK